MPGAATFTMKPIADRSTQRLLGVQVAGPGAVDKIVDITVTAIQCGATLDQLDGGRTLPMRHPSPPPFIPSPTP